jgi:glyoxylase-like metal-dependent hydrolase (beta-lactamase superfamily II)/rhodanese-related sulfurtransferase
MNIKQIYDEALAHASYAIESNGQVALVDPGRNPQPYLDFAKEHSGKIVAVFETHPHADFASGHLEFQKKFNADIYINPKVGVSYDFKPLQHNEEVTVGNVVFRAQFTPGHSPDHNSYLLLGENGKQQAVFTGDSLFVGNVGRPDLREGTGSMHVSKKELAGMMYHTINDIFRTLDEEVTVYPAHGPGSLCGKNVSPELHSTIGKQKQENWAFQLNDKEQFMSSFLEGQPFIPKYFPYEVELNRKGAKLMGDSIQQVTLLESGDDIAHDSVIIDVRSQEQFKAGHFEGAINIQLGGESSKFETWLGSIVAPDEKFYLIAGNKEELDNALLRTAKIGYETNIIGATYSTSMKAVTEPLFNIADFKENPDKYTIVDIRNTSEVDSEKFFEMAINIPLPELRERASELPTDKPVVVHCAGGYRSAAGSSILASEIDKATVYDLSETINEFVKDAQPA